MKQVITFLFVIVLAAVVYAATMSKRTWEYQFLEIDKLEVTRSKLNKLDGDGWEVVGMDGGVFLLKRRHQEQ